MLQLGTKHQLDFLDVATSLHLGHDQVVKLVFGSDLLDIDLIVQLEDGQLGNPLARDLNDGAALDIATLLHLDDEAGPRDFGNCGLDLTVITNDDHIAITHHRWQVEVVDLKLLFL